MIEKDDWRLQGQEDYLMEITLVRRPCRQYAKNPNWDHDHCEFCWAKFSLNNDDVDTLQAGYSTTDEYRWICPSCFEDFKEMFKWNVVDPTELKNNN